MGSILQKKKSKTTFPNFVKVKLEVENSPHLVSKPRRMG